MSAAQINRGTNNESSHEKSEDWRSERSKNWVEQDAIPVFGIFRFATFLTKASCLGRNILSSLGCTSGNTYICTG
jgi:hypothetical protein